MTEPTLFRQLKRRPVIAILRGCPYVHARAIAGAAITTGIAVIEVTLDSERALEQIESIRAEFDQAEVGVGTVRRAEEVAAAVRAGARFVVSPIVDPEVIGEATRHGVPVIPGAATPTEIDQALRLGADAVKIFPIAQLGGPEYLRAIRAPLGEPPLIPTGGVAVDSIGRYLDAGCLAVGLGGNLFPKRALADGDTDTVSRLAEEVLEVLP